ncbi:MAG: cation:proton antiporter [Candidatus Sumerlaeia bacterium]|nr:cation:proton antiporter [Candidatus Sumerlaeia bacterium]
MQSLTHSQITVMFLAVGTLLLLARAFGEVARRFGQPAVLGEMLAGILLGPTVLGQLAPDLMAALFPREGPNALVLSSFATLSVALFLLVAGLEVDLSTATRQGRTAITVSALGIAVPFALGFGAASLAPASLGGVVHDNPWIFPLFFATALSISALPVIAKTLMDLDLYRTDLGMVVIAAAVLNDLAGWIIFAVILGLIGTAGGHALPVSMTIALTLGFTAFVLTAGRAAVHRALPWVLAHTSWPGGILAFALALALFSAAFTEWIGVHAIFGAFLVGVAIGDSSHMREQTRATINHFVSSIFAPLFFATIGLRVDFVANFDPGLVLLVLVIACAGKIAGCGLAGLWSGMERREAWAVGFAMNARGAMEIILGLLALQYGVIDQRMFVALVVMALATSLMSGPAIQRLLQRERPRRFTDHLSGKTFVCPLRAQDRRGAITELAEALAPSTGLAPGVIDAAAWAREEIMSTGTGGGLALPHARLPSIRAPAVALGVSPEGVDFNSPDGEPAHLIFLILTPAEDGGAQLEILKDIAKTFRDTGLREKATRARTHTEFLAALKTH